MLVQRLRLLQQKHIRQIAVLAILSQVIAKHHGHEADIDLLRELAKVTTAIETIVDDTPKWSKLRQTFSNYT